MHAQLRCGRARPPPGRRRPSGPVLPDGNPPADPPRPPGIAGPSGGANSPAQPNGNAPSSGSLQLHTTCSDVERTETAVPDGGPLIWSPTSTGGIRFFNRPPSLFSGVSARKSGKIREVVCKETSSTAGASGGLPAFLATFARVFVDDHPAKRIPSTNGRWVFTEDSAAVRSPPGSGPGPGKPGQRSEPPGGAALPPCYLSLG